MKVTIVLVLGTVAALAAPRVPSAKAEPSAHKKLHKVAVCPQLPPRLNSAFWDGEELWPDCPVGSPISSSGGRCLDGTSTCMRPCASKVSGRGIDDSATYTYDANGRLVSATLTRSFGGGTPTRATNTCKRDENGHRTSCTSWIGEETYQYKNAALAGSVTTKDGKINGTSIVRRDPHGRVVEMTWQLGPLGPYQDTMSYNDDGTLATYVSKDRVLQTTKTFTYRKGHLLKVHLEPKGGGYSKGTDIAYSYDAAGRVIEERHTGYAPSTYAYSYDADGRLLSENIEDGLLTTYQYTCK